MKLKYLISLCGIGIASAPVAMSSHAIVETENQNSIEVERLFNSIKTGSKPIEEIEKWSVDGLDFYDENNLNNYLIEQGNIEKVATSSNPSKIIKDHANGILDESKIYDLDQNQYQRIYRDAFGNTALTKKAALDTYVNMGSVNHKYSYDNYSWFDSPEEAKNDYVYQGGLRKSLYYFINGRYYNVFNSKDRQDLLNTFKEGYRITPSDMTNHQTIYGTKNNVATTVKSTLRSVWTKGKNSAPKGEMHYSNYITKDAAKFVNIRTSQGIYLEVWYKGDNAPSWWPAGFSDIEYLETETAPLIFDDKSIDAKYLSDKVNWKRVLEKDGNEDLKETFTLEKGGMNQETKRKFTKIRIRPIEDLIGIGYSKVNFNIQNFADSSKTNIQLYSDLEKKNKIYDRSYDRCFGSFSDFSTYDVNNLYDDWFEYFKDKELFKNIPKSLDGKLNEIGRPVNAYGVANDYLYDVNGQQGEKYSYYESQNQYNKIMMNEILNGETKVENGVTVYKIREDFEPQKNKLKTTCSYMEKWIQDLCIHLLMNKIFHHKMD
ncbi:hypothetical protein SCLARK_00563 [Spiroplasma clarkii]|uniref:hypothetical protein n=1 Tax=Spiroplasma clarkii TaxID=2139 RepID=UPI000B557FF7|nr:hypothetical protein [Spiroplasma clarkii]ARU91245.1 hypothetical protein SCLARK_00563 [Spiroplasma clarkii]